MVNRYNLKDDLMAGITVAVVVLPQGVAYAMIAGLPPIYGLYSAIVIPIVASLFGSSFHLISGPTAALSIVVFSSISAFAEPGTAVFISLVFVLTFIVGLIQLLLGVIRLGSLVNFVSHSVIVGFTTGAAILIATSQLKHVFGLDIPLGNGFFNTWNYVLSHIYLSNWYVFGVAIFTILLALILKRFYPKTPFLLTAMIGGSLLSYFFFREDYGIPLVNQIPAVLPSLSFPEISYSSLLKLTPNALAIAFLGLTEAVAISRAIAIRSSQRLNANQEFIGQGLSNLIGSMFMNFVGSGSFTRSSINYQSGAKTPLSGIISSIALIFILLFVAPLTAYLPISTLGGVILIVSYNLIDFKEIKKIARTSKKEFVIMLVTFFSTLFIHLEYAIYIGVMMSIVLYLRQISRPQIKLIVENKNESVMAFSQDENLAPEDSAQLTIIEPFGSIFFASLEHIGDEIDAINEKGIYTILMVCNAVNHIDMAGAEYLYSKSLQLKKNGGALYLCGLNPITQNYLSEAGYIEKIGKENVFSSKEIGLKEINKKHKKSPLDQEGSL